MKKVYHYGVYKNGKVFVDEEIDYNRACQSLYHVGPDYEAYSVVATSKEIFKKKLRKYFEDNIKDLEKEIKKNEKILDKLKEGKYKDNHHKQLADYPIDRIIFSDDLEKYRQVNGFLNDKGNEIFSKRVKDYLDKKRSDKK